MAGPSCPVFSDSGPDACPYDIGRCLDGRQIEPRLDLGQCCDSSLSYRRSDYKAVMGINELAPKSHIDRESHPGLEVACVSFASPAE